MSEFFLRIDFQKRNDKDKEFKHFKAFMRVVKLPFQSGMGSVYFQYHRQH